MILNSSKTTSMRVIGKRLHSKVSRQPDITANGFKIDQVTFRRCTLAIVIENIENNKIGTAASV